MVIRLAHRGAPKEGVDFKIKVTVFCFAFDRLILQIIYVMEEITKIIWIVILNAVAFHGRYIEAEITLS